MCFIHFFLTFIAKRDIHICVFFFLLWMKGWNCIIKIFKIYDFFHYLLIFLHVYENTFSSNSTTLSLGIIYKIKLITDSLISATNIWTRVTELNKLLIHFCRVRWSTRQQLAKSSSEKKTYWGKHSWLKLSFESWLLTSRRVPMS